MKNKKQGKMPLSAIALYIVSVVFLMIAAYQIFNCYDYINSLVEQQGFVISDNLSDVFKYYVTNCSAYFAYAIMIYAAGACLDKLHQNASNAYEIVEETEENDDDEFMDEFEGDIAYEFVGTHGRRKKSPLGARHIKRYPEVKKAAKTTKTKTAKTSKKEK